jgi:protein-disulfide isomerase
MTTNGPARAIQAPKARPAPGPTPSLPSWLSPRRLLLLALAAAVVIAGVLIGVGVAGSGSSTPGGPKALVGSPQTTALLAGIPQQGIALGRAHAPVTLSEYADPACPYCMHFSRDVLPTLIKQYVRTGKLRILFNGLAFVGPASEQGLRAIDAAAAQNRAWYVIELLYRNQGDETTNWVSQPLLQTLSETVPGLDGPKLLRDMSSSRTTAAIAATESRARAAGVQETPTFFVGRTGSTLQRLGVQSLVPGAFTPTIDRLLAR